MKKLIALMLLLAALPVAAQQKVNTDKHGIAVSGYDVVAYFTENTARKGNKDISFEHEGATYLFATEANRKLFRENPEKYLPRFGGWCAYGMSEGYKASVDPKAFTVYNGVLYLNYSLGVREEWQKNKDARIKKAEANWPAVSQE
ncbi:YHS domain-containing protein [Flavobacterium sp. D11R37]|uniref:YHS domain-containing (seleno)protein n=1 Tax=Flavobacterium coralii TaxID=2838017 RepID=UPI001CA763CB|nr:YHS domain-containing (seleno)protein [Flavobacterium coralii]MBY8961307.1 YHS domain-containing protein [Flavobacterium coralii]